VAVPAKQVKYQGVKERADGFHTINESHQAVNDEHIIEKNMLSKTVVELIVSHIKEVLNNKLVKPIANYGVNALVTSASKSIQRASTKYGNTVKDQIQDFQAQRELVKSDTDKLKDPKNTQDKKQHQGMLNAQIEGVKNTGEGGLIHLKALCENIGRPIEVYKDGKRYYTAGNHTTGEAIKLNYQPPTKENKGHWDLKDTQAPQTGHNNCLFDAIAAQVGNTDAKKLRATVASTMRAKEQDYIRLMPSVQRLNNHANPVKAKKLLHMGGVKSTPVRVSSSKHYMKRQNNIKVHRFSLQKAGVGDRTGTNTNYKVRQHVNNPTTRVPRYIKQKIEYFHDAKKQWKIKEIMVRNPRPKGGSYDAGHILARQNGGKGNDPNMVIPQHPTLNRYLKKGIRFTIFASTIKKFRVDSWRKFEDYTNRQVSKRNEKVYIKSTHYYF
jgi:hypothetical protein